jgi:diaminohydroxyphosphoribosylaminopyrimidine deaminase/5-amino-6-(5-phosphoribosylamino)uracil reductase
MEQEHFMRRALSLAKLGLGKVKTNPMVGCVIAKNNSIIGEGYHEEFGKAHAEVNALKNLSKSELIDAEAFVTLEPCSHFGKTPPCADLLISSGIKKVNIAMLDTNPLVAGSGMQKMIDNGMDVSLGLMEQEAIALNSTFLHGITKNQPYITLKWAESSDGYIAGLQGNEKISGPDTNIISHRFRTEIDAICVGSTTITTDAPKLDTRLVAKQQKEKVSFGSSPHEGYLRLNPENIASDLEQLYKEYNIGHLLIEGGSKTLQFFLNNSLFNQIRHIQSKNVSLNHGTKAPSIPLNKLNAVNQFSTNSDFITIYQPC